MFNQVVNRLVEPGLVNILADVEFFSGNRIGFVPDIAVFYCAQQSFIHG